jgi:hypothetical protein
MSKNALIAALAAVVGMLLGPMASASAIVLNINEIRIDQPSTDNDEYFELYGTGSDPLTGVWYVVIGDGTDGSGVIENATDLSSYSVPGDGYLVAAEGTFTLGTADLTTTLDFENGDNVTHLLVTGFTGSDGDDLDTDDNGTLDTTPWTSVLDCVALIEESNPPSGTEYEYATDLGYPTVGPDGIYVPGHVYRFPCGTGSWNIGVFDPFEGGQDTPGNVNVPVELSSFAGSYQGDVVVLTWVTQSERDNFGFHLYRSSDATGSYVRLTDNIIPGAGTSAEPRTYRYTDSDVASQITYWYKLEDVDLSGTSTFHGPVQVVCGGTAASWGSLKASFRQ